MTSTNPRIPDFVGMYSPKTVKEGVNQSVIPQKGDNAAAIFNFAEDSSAHNGISVEKQAVEKPVKELSLKEQKKQAKAKLKELKEIARALKKEAAKADASNEIKQAAVKAQKDVDKQVIETYKIRKAYAKSIGKESDFVQRKENNIKSKNDNKKSEVRKADVTRGDDKSEIKSQENKVNEKPHAEKTLSLQKNNKENELYKSGNRYILQNPNEKKQDFSAYIRKSPLVVKTHKEDTSVVQENSVSACFVLKENNVCDEKARYSSQYELYDSTSERKTIENVLQKTAQKPVMSSSNNENVQVETKQDISEMHMEQKDSYKVLESDLDFFKDDSKPLYKNDEKIKIQNEYACNELDKASNDKMKGQFEVTKSADGKSCEVDFDANKSNIIPEDTRNDYSSVDGKLDDYYQVIGDCFFMATLRDKDINIKDLISSQNNDNKPPYIVKFPTKNQNNAMYKLEDFSTQIVTAEDLEKLNFSTGDLEARILEVALNKAVGKSYVNKLARITQNTENEQEVKSAVDKTLKGFHYKDGLSSGHVFIEGGSTFLAKEVLTGKTHKPYVLNENNQKEIETLIQNKKITGITLSNNKITLSSGLEIIGNHEYSIVGTKTNDKGEFVFVIDDNYDGKHYTKIAENQEIPLSELIKYRGFIQFE